MRGVVGLTRHAGQPGLYMGSPGTRAQLHRTMSSTPSPMTLNVVHETATLDPPPCLKRSQWALMLGNPRALATFVPYLLRNVPNMHVEPDNHGGWLVKYKGNTYRLRVHGERGVTLSPSKSRGTGRRVAPKHFRQAFGEVDGFMVAKFIRPGYKVQFATVRADELWRCYNSHVMARNGAVANKNLRYD